ncbi:short coiled-coil protein A [Pimephales promelas]|nr:short coiled-coil protein A [Pimephales promelas]KAG1956505.1 short coiled-coil protein A [Pimephales promelas]
MEDDVDEANWTFTNISLDDETADGEQTVLRFRPEEEYSNMNCEIDDVCVSFQEIWRTRLSRRRSRDS